jgi:aldehyde:ferredoxin oxidoreductase
VTGGYAGKILRVDLTDGRIWNETLTAEESRREVGAVGIGTRILWEEVPGHVGWDHPDNRLILGSGPLAGTPIWGTGTLTVMTKGALTNGATVTNAQGFFGANLKYCGYDAIVLQGQSEKWVYLYVNDDVVELRDASHLMGMDTWETQDTLQEEYGLPGHLMSVYGIGPAGENVVRFAVIEGDYGHVASKNGAGAVMGKKKLKCVAIARGTKAVHVYDSAGLYQAADMISHDLKTGVGASRTYNQGTVGGVAHSMGLGTVPVKNYTTNIFPEKDRLEEWTAERLSETVPGRRGHQCSACGMKGHCHIVVIPSGPHKGKLVDEPEYEGMAGCGSQLGIVNPVEAMWLNTQVDKAGVDVNEYSWVTGWVMECYEKGYITKEQIGLEMKWGDAEAAERLLQMIAQREGFGDLLAEGVKRAAEHVGGPALDCAIYINNGVTPMGHDHRARWSMMLDFSMSNDGTIESGGIMTHPEEFGLPATFDAFDPEMVGYVTAAGLGRRHFEDSLGTCHFTTRTYMSLICSALNAVTGWDYTKEEALAFGKRCSALMRVFNLRSGLGMAAEKPSERYWSTPVDGPAAGRSAKENWDVMVNAYYETYGLDGESGRPLPETLRRLGLEDIIPEIWGKEEVRVGG